MNIFTLPEVSNKLVPFKTNVNKPDLTVLTEQQVNGFNKLKEFVESNDHYIRVKGKAGSGKTFLISIFIEWLLSQDHVTTICQCAPTNKAVRVMYDMAKYKNTRLDYKTIHSLLGIKLSKKDGQQSFVQDGIIRINNFTLKICDESSMIHPEIFELMLSTNDTKIIFVGDINQLPPVITDDDRRYWLSRGYDPNISPVWQMNMDEIVMDYIVRQSHNNPILNLADFTINNVYYPKEDFDSNLHDDGSGYPIGVLQFNKRSNDDFGIFSDLLIHYFTSNNYSNDTNFCKVLCFTNNLVNSYNNTIRYYYFGEDPDLSKITQGERLIVSDGVKDLEYEPMKKGDERLLFTTNDELEVVDYTISRLDNVMDKSLNYYHAQVMNINNPQQDHQYINIIHEDSEETLKNILNSIAAAAKSAKHHSIERRDLWTAFHDINDFFAKVAYSYALTVHKSQGSTYDNVIFDMSDLKYVRINDTKKKLQYTAMTRARKRLHIVY